MTRTAVRTGVARVCDELLTLTPAELEQVRLRAAFLAGGREAKTDALSAGDRDWLLRGIEDELRRRGVLGAGRLPADKVVPGWGTTSAAVRTDLVRALGGRPDPRELAAFGRAVARCLADWLDNSGIPVRPRTMLANAGRALVAVDAQFPGYAGAGLLRCVVDVGALGRM